MRDSLRPPYSSRQHVLPQLEGASGVPLFALHSGSGTPCASGQIVGDLMFDSVGLLCAAGLAGDELRRAGFCGCGGGSLPAGCRQENREFLGLSSCPGTTAVVSGSCCCAVWLYFQPRSSNLDPFCDIQFSFLLPRKSTFGAFEESTIAARCKI
jgi:hypothetical protein